MSKIEQRNQVLALIMQGYNVNKACTKIGYNKVAISNLKRRNPIFARKLLYAQAIGSIRRIIAAYQPVKQEKV